ncbi:hypothetical protein A7U60_g5443 [Sanghuangporus baumii]|uniref:RlpA-like protein double-psi beta-barrel domain-containing protein n=1 Tax=Sanghuangporus baumii TaxID=108892 RepID=A0A9Q5HWY5_SANBA|nr:hypothetical protein A7U60_g5443 [Sanghuangporus baumii]
MMLSLSLTSASTLFLALFLAHTTSATSIQHHPDTELREYYTRSHALANDYHFDPREWEAVNVTDLSYKYDQATPVKREHKPKSGKSNKNSAGTLFGLTDALKAGLKAIGGAEKVEITWYTGHDLLNPSCWSNTDWAPTDDSFACALTLDGWLSQPKCFKFLELCNGPSKCVFVRKVDSCAGCAPGSKHVDLTKGAFSQLADPNEGVLNVMMRQSTDPHVWLEELWGPKH